MNSQETAYKIQTRALGIWITKDTVYTDRYTAYNLMRDALEQDEIAQVGRTLKFNPNTMTYSEDLVSNRGGEYIGVE